LRDSGLIIRTGQKGPTPSGKEAYMCVITRAGEAYLKMWGYLQADD
jgi:hypothetical protein